jgi:hypothetical protein
MIEIELRIDAQVEANRAAAPKRAKGGRGGEGA